MLNEGRANKFCHVYRFNYRTLIKNIFLVNTDCSQSLLYNDDIRASIETASCQPIIRILLALYAVCEIKND